METHAGPPEGPSEGRGARPHPPRVRPPGPPANVPGERPTLVIRSGGRSVPLGSSPTGGVSAGPGPGSATGFSSTWTAPPGAPLPGGPASGPESSWREPGSPGRPSQGPALPRALVRPGVPRRRRGPRGAVQVRRRRAVAGALAVVVLALVAVGLVRITSAVPVPTVRSAVTSWRLPGTPAAIPWPAGLQASVAIPEVGYQAQSGVERPAAIASIAKVMTAFVVLHDHPLGLSSSGPTIPISAKDVADFAHDTVTDQASIPLANGEVLTERQLLEGMLVHSADDYADALARWDAGSLTGFVTKMNATARTMGMTQTHFADASGFSPQTTGTAADVLKVTAAAMANPVVAATVAIRQMTFPLGGLEISYTPLLGTNGIVGVKSGFTAAAGGCDVLALRPVVDGHPVLVLAAVLGIQGPNALVRVASKALAVARAAAGSLSRFSVVRAGTKVATVTLGRLVVPATVSGSATFTGWPGQAVSARLEISGPLRAGARAGERIGTVVYRSGPQVARLPVVLTARLPSRGLLQRLL